jgi:hypothetical protein
MNLTKISVDDVVATCDENNIAWDHDPAFMSICKGLVGKALLSDMKEEELKDILTYIRENPHPFTKKSSDNRPDFFRTNYDYNGDFLDKVRSRLKTLKRNVEDKDARAEIEKLEKSTT